MLSRAVGVWDPTSTESATSSTAPPLPTSAGALGAQMTLKELDVARILREGQLLLASSGKEYGKLAQMSEADLARAQKDVMKNLGLGLGGTDDDIGVDVSAELASGMRGANGPGDASAGPAPPARPALPPPRFKPGGPVASAPLTPSAKASPVPSAPSGTAAPASISGTSTPEAGQSPAAGEADPYAGLSAREKNKLKRKRKAEEKAGIAPSPIALPTAKKAKVASPAPIAAADRVKAESSADRNVKLEGDDNPADSKVVIDPAAKAKERERLGGEIQAKLEAERATTEVKAGEWPWRAVVERLAVGLLASSWEMRHGAALGLRELLRLQASGGGKLEGVTASENQELHKHWLEDLSAKLLYVFALDRFGDYVSDQVRLSRSSGTPQVV